MIIDCIADLHGYYPQLEGGDLLIVAGDLTARDTPLEHLEFTKWLCSRPYKMKIFVGGNHDNAVEKYAVQGSCGDSCWYLCDSGTEFEGLKIWGSPWTKSFPGMNPHCKAFTLDTEEELAEKWALIPDDIDILVTHPPGWGSFDVLSGYDEDRDVRAGSPSLTKWIANHVHTLKLHIFGHIHEGYGVYDIRKYQKESGDPITPIFVNASHVNEYYEPVNKPIRVIL